MEFLEFIGRVSFEHFKNTAHELEWGLAQKIELILKELFKPLGQAVTVPRERDQFVSDSDDDY